MTCPDLHFGGVGESGMGAYNGKSTFETFSHRKPVRSGTYPGSSLSCACECVCVGVWWGPTRRTHKPTHTVGNETQHLAGSFLPVP